MSDEKVSLREVRKTAESVRNGPIELQRAAALPASDPKRDREGEMCEAAYRCVNPECLRPWIVFAVHGEPTDGIDDPRVCRFCGADGARRVR